MPKCNIAVATIGIDPGKNTLHLVGLDARGGIVLREKVARARIVSWLANVPPCLIGIEAGMGTHYVTRELLALGHDVRQVPPDSGRLPRCQNARPKWGSSSDRMTARAGA